MRKNYTVRNVLRKFTKILFYKVNVKFEDIYDVLSKSILKFRKMYRIF